MMLFLEFSGNLEEFWDILSDMNRVVVCKYFTINIKKVRGSFPAGAVAEHLSASAGDSGLIPDLGRAYLPKPLIHNF